MKDKPYERLMDNESVEDKLMAKMDEMIVLLRQISNNTIPKVAWNTWPPYNDGTDNSGAWTTFDFVPATCVDCQTSRGVVLSGSNEWWCNSCHARHFNKDGSPKEGEPR